jgi:SIR2-like domain
MLAVPPGKDTLVLLGAGASQEAGVPTTFEMTERLVEGVGRSSRPGSAEVSALHFVCASLMAHDAATRGQSPFAGLDVERVFTAVELLAERDDLEVTPFVASWHPGVDLWDTKRISGGPGRFNKRLQEALLDSPSFGGAQQLITELINSQTGAAADGTTYRILSKSMLRQLGDLVATTPKQVAYLSPLMERAGDGGLTIATLNYDLSIEHAAQAGGVPCETGIADWLRTGRWAWADTGVRLLKVHGSIDWVWEELETEPGNLPQRGIFLRHELEQRDRAQPALVFGHRGKLRAEGPFLGLLAELEAMMARVTHLTVIGYSFRDDHVNEVISRWTFENPARTLTVVDPNWPQHYRPGLNRDFREELNLHLNPAGHGDDFEPRLRVIRATCADALPELFP